jgi:hypothetical protein
MQNENQPVECHMVVQTDSPERTKWKETNETEKLEGVQQVQVMIYDCVK